MLITANGKMIRMHVNDIRIISRVTQGVRLIDLDEGDKLVSATTVEPEEDATLNGNGVPKVENEKPAEPASAAEKTSD